MSNLRHLQNSSLPFQYRAINLRKMASQVHVGQVANFLVVLVVVVVLVALNTSCCILCVAALVVVVVAMLVVEK